MEIARRYGLSRGGVHQLTGQSHFPRPVHGQGTSRPLWLAIDVERYRSQPPPAGPGERHRPEPRNRPAAATPQ